MRTRSMQYSALMALIPASAGGAQQVADSAFDVSVAQPAFVSRHPHVVVDEAHLNFHTSTGRYFPFASLLRNDGARVSAGTTPFSAQSLRGVDVLVIANALGPGANSGTDTSPPAFTETECDAVRDWVRAGGSLLLIADHTPFGDAAQNLASRFGIVFGKGFVLDSAHSLPESPSLLAFEASLLGSHAIIDGRNASERVRRVVAFTGQSMTVPPGATALLILSPTAREAPTRADRARGVTAKPVGAAQGLAMPMGAGRVVALGEAAMMSAQLAGPPGGPEPRGLMGMNHPGTDDKQFALNVVRWLAGALGP